MSLSFKLMADTVHLDRGIMWASVQFADQLGAATIQIPGPVTREKFLAAASAAHDKRAAEKVAIDAVKATLAEFCDKEVTVDVAEIVHP